MDIKEISKEIYDNNVAKGFWDEDRNVGEMLMLVVSELSEALEAHRKDKYSNRKSMENDMHYARLSMDNFVVGDENCMWIANRFEGAVKDGFEDEISDAVIRLLDISQGLGIDLEWHIRAKLNYNKTRPHKHGKKY